MHRLPRTPDDFSAVSAAELSAEKPDVPKETSILNGLGLGESTAFDFTELRRDPQYTPEEQDTTQELMTNPL